TGWGGIMEISVIIGAVRIFEGSPRGLVLDSYQTWRPEGGVSSDGEALGEWLGASPFRRGFGGSLD
ncbi:MAG: hypothetical protein AAF699_22400, partial [Pseudomonadota bacterium]